MIKRLKRRFILVNMTIVTTIVACLFAIVCIFTVNSQKEQNLKYLELSIMRSEHADSIIGQAPPINVPDIEGEGFDMPPIYTFLVFVDKNGKATKLEGGGEIVKQDFIKAIVSEAFENEDYYGEVDDGRLMYLMKETRGGSIISFASTEPSDEYVSSTVLLFLFLCLGSLVLFFIISERLAHYAVMPVKKAWENQKQFVADVSHDLKTPLTVILANNDIINSHSEENVSSQQKWFDSTCEEALKMKALVTQMLDLAKSENAVSMAVAPLNLSELTEREILHLEPIAFEKQIAICSSISPGVTVNTNEEAFLRIVQTLLDNAIKYSKKEKKIRVSLAGDRQRVYLYVNNSSYIEEEKLSHVFERFWREDSSRSDDSHGLGLAIAKNLANSLNGDLTVKSNPVEGTTFMLTLKRR